MMNTTPSHKPFSRSPSVQMMTDMEGEHLTSSHNKDQPPPISCAAESISSALMDQSLAQQLIAKCEEIKLNRTFILPGTRQSLAKFLIDNQIMNPGNLNAEQRWICRWMLLEQEWRSQTGPEIEISEQIKSFSRPGDESSILQIAGYLGLKLKSFSL